MSLLVRRQLTLTECADGQWECTDSGRCRWM